MQKRSKNLKAPHPRIGDSMTIEKEAKTTEAAITEALKELGKSKDQVKIEVFRKEGLFKTACVRVTEIKNKGEIAEEFVNELLEKMGINSEAYLDKSDGTIKINITGPDNGIVIGYRGEVLDAIQYLTALYAGKNSKDGVKVSIDAENYRDKTLINLAQRLADKAIRTGRSVEVEPMNPYERKVFHTALSDNGRVTTESEGEEPMRYVVIKPVKEDIFRDFSKKGVGKIKTYGVKKKYF
jgi:spoIIIJ-associated protein